MKKRSRWLSLAVGVFCLIFLALPVMAAVLSHPSTIEDELPMVGGLPVLGLNMQPVNNTFYAEGRHWVFYVDEDSDLVYKSAKPGGTWREGLVSAETLLYGPEYAVWYDAPTNTVHYARHYFGVSDETRYRMGTPNSNGTITWAAAEQTVSLTPGDLVTFRVAICVDENGYPWVAWIDTDGTNPEGIVYVESSTTKNGAWTEGVTQRCGLGGTLTNGTGIATGSPITLAPGTNDITITQAGTFNVFLPIGGSGTATTDDWVVTGSPQTLNEGNNTVTVEAGGGPGGIIITSDLDEHAWFLSVTPVGVGADTNIVEVQWSAEDTSGGIDDGKVGLYSTIYNNTGAGSWSTRDDVVAKGSMSATRPDAFCFHDYGTLMCVTYTDTTGAIIYRERGALETWEEASAGEQIKYNESITWIPTLSGFDAALSEQELLCIAHNEDAIYYATHDIEDTWDVWSTWTLLWVTPDLGNDVISRHVASYKYSSPVGFAWQYTDDSDEPDLDTLHFWWIDNENGVGWYTAQSVGADLMRFFVPIVAAVGIVLMALGAWGKSPKLMLYGAVFGVAAFILISTIVDFI